MNGLLRYTFRPPATCRRAAIGTENDCSFMVHLAVLAVIGLPNASRHRRASLCAPVEGHGQVNSLAT